MSDDFAIDFYKKMLQAVTGRKSRDEKRRISNSKKSSQPFEKGREPFKASDSVDDLLQDYQWSDKVTEAELFTNWAVLIGEETARASKPEALSGKTLHVRCISTAWATQLRMLQPHIIEKINLSYPQLEIDTIKFTGPDAPSWKKGSRSVPGRGPRDTYG